MDNAENKMGTVSAEAKTDNKRIRRKALLKEIVIDVIWMICLAAVLAVFFHYYSITRIIGESMEPTYSDGDVLIMVRNFTVNYNDVVVADTDANLIIKRVIGLAGDEIDIRDGHVYRNGELLEEDYTQGETYAYDQFITFPLTLGEGQVFLLGDNREISADSRSSKYGPVSADVLIGKAAVLVPVFWKNIIIGAVAILLVYLIVSSIKQKETPENISEDGTAKSETEDENKQL